MNLLENLLSRMGYQRIQKRSRYDFATQDRLTNDWVSTTVSANSKLQYNLPVMRARAREMRDNDTYAQKFVQMVRCNVVGEKGVHLTMRAMIDGPGGTRLDMDANRRIEQAWNEWSKPENCTVTGRLHWRDVQRLAMDSIVSDGEVLILKRRGSGAGRFNFNIRLLESDYLDHTLTKGLEGGRRITMGVEHDANHKPLAYWLHKDNPSNTTGLGTLNRQHIRIQAEDVIHAYIQRRPEQARGIPWLVVSGARMNMLSGYEESEAVAARVAASKMGFLKRTGAQQYSGEEDAAGNRLMDVSPGSFETLPVGMEVQSFDPQHPNSSYAEFVKASLRGVAAGLGVTYHSLASDFESVNFSSGRLASREEQDFYKAIQCWFVDAIVNNVFTEWLALQLGVTLPSLPANKFEKFNRPEWRPRRWSYIDPQKEIQANVTAIQAGLTSRTRVLSELGIDFNDVAQELAQEKETLAALGLPTGAAPAANPAPAETKTMEEDEDTKTDDDGGPAV